MTLATELKAFQKACTHLLSLRWNEQTTIPGAASQGTTFDFAGLLASYWITGTHIDMMFQNLSERTESNDVLDTLVIIENLRFMNDINKAKAVTDHNKPLTKFLKWLEDQIKSNDSNKLVFPAHMEKMKHWIAVEIDFKARTISYANLTNVAQGDSLSHEEMPYPKAVMKKLQWELGDNLVHGKQEDGTECGILTANTIAHTVFQDPLWVVSRKEVERVGWFNQLVEAHIREVRF
ncbi:hypothetical protein K443DRAFT_126315 [Laccaria amethystina LaAM-08-1]|uniref:Ubiquitin-like protease family profile domain-containing protein n=1 Tax=Laccaria amethystina LaAM-08-1 TaxID=1095629 RepID=A0A0C9X0U8_9AGAR|nr:hypothetical protein K443DRAFT_126315 [Laccaria amethystina LaAM-08-1]